ncbi:MAG: hypothetical protein NVSMB2_09090 [Chloroflexota bacterium]
MRLSPRGEIEAQNLATFLGRRPLAAVYSSPMLRARKTAARILSAQPDLDRVRIDADLQEVKTGWQGEPQSSLEAINWDFYAHPRFPDDDTLQTVQARMHRWLARMLHRHAGTEIVGVSHGDPILILSGRLRGIPLEGAHIFPRPYIHTGALFRLDFDSRDACLGVTLFDRDLATHIDDPRGVAA